MGKDEFIMQFVLNRASTNAEETDGEFWAYEAIKAWKLIEEETRFKKGLGALVKNV